MKGIKGLFFCKQLDLLVLYGILTLVDYLMPNPVFIYIVVSKVGNCSQGRPEGSPFNTYYTGVREGATLFPGLFHFTLDTYLIMLSVKQGSIKYHFLSLWYDSTWD